MSSNSNHWPNKLGQQQQQHQKATIQKQNAISVTLTPDSTDGSQRKTSIQNQTLDCQPPMLNTQMVHESACRSASSSPWIARRADDRPDSKIDPSVACSLNVPMNFTTRKLSLQPVVGQQQSSNTYSTGSQQQLQQSPLLKQQPPFTNNLVGYPNATGGVATNFVSYNNLSVNNQHFLPRKSIIGRLERSSFQTQRLSDVGVAVGQQITAKMGLRIPASQERIVEQTRWLYLRYVFVKLRQNTLPLRDLNLSKSSRARRAAALGEPIKISCSAPASAAVILESPSTAPISLSSRKRTLLVGNDDINPEDLSMLASKLRTSNHKNSKTSSNVGDTLISPFMNGTSSATVGGKKYIMDPAINNQILTVILDIIRELRELKPEFYGDTIYEIIGIDKFTSIQTLLDVQMTICQEMTRSEISWCRISALFSLFGAMSLDCVRLGAPEHVGPILDGFIEFVERDLAFWISQQGGWESFLYKFRSGYRLRHLTTKFIILALPIFVWAIFSLAQ